jgi:hypothetical protein
MGWEAKNEIGCKMAAEFLCCHCNHHRNFPVPPSIPRLFRKWRMRAELCQGYRLVGNLACILGDSVEWAEELNRADSESLGNMSNKSEGAPAK